MTARSLQSLVLSFLQTHQTWICYPCHEGWCISGRPGHIRKQVLSADLKVLTDSWCKCNITTSGAMSQMCGGSSIPRNTGSLCLS